MRIRSIRTLLFALVVLSMLLSLSVVSFAQVRIRVGFAPPALPVYEQPICPGDGYLWTPGYWAWGDDFDDYYWIPGTWVLAPEVGYLWTPGYWGWDNDAFFFNEGYWGPGVGFYGGINYGFGYFGTGFEGGRWDNGHFFYNRAVVNINVTNIHNVYETKVNVNENRVSFNGGNGGINARATAEQENAARERHIAPVAAQVQHAQEARSNPEQRASRNEGKPPIAASAKPGEFKGGDVVKAREAGAPYKRPANAGTNQPRENANQPRENANEPRENTSAPRTAAGHIRELPPAEKPAAPNTGDAKLDKKYQQQQDKQYGKQQQERQKLQQQQEKEDQKVAKQNNEAQKQQVEQRHQQQTQQLQQRHQQQSQQMQQRMQPPAPRPQGNPH